MAAAAVDLDDTQLDKMFARDLINVVTRRHIKGFELEGIPDGATPYCFRVRLAIDNYLTHQWIEMYYDVSQLLLNRKFANENFTENIWAYNNVIFPEIITIPTLLMHVSFLATIAAKAVSIGIDTAPIKMLPIIELILHKYRLQMSLSSKDFWKMIRDGAPEMTNGLQQLRNLHGTVQDDITFE